MCHVIDNKRLSLLAHVATTQWLDDDLCSTVYWQDATTFQDVCGTKCNATDIYKIFLEQNLKAVSEGFGEDVSPKYVRTYEPEPGRMLDAIAYARGEGLATKVEKNNLALQVLLIAREYEHQCSYGTGYRFSEAYRIVDGIKAMLCQVLTHDVQISDAFGEGWNDRYAME